MTVPAELHQAIDAWADAHREDVIRLTESLVRFPSLQRVPTGDERDCQLLVAEVMRAQGMEVDVFDPIEVPGFTEHEIYWPGRDYRNRPNVVGTWRGAETAGGRSLLFSSHIDVVAGSVGGRFDPFTPTRADGRLYGRGSNDMKGGLAASLMAVRLLRELGVRLRGDLLVESVVDEEMGGSNGTLAARLRGYQADGCIVPEPNGMRVSPAHRGGAMWRITLTGSSGMPFGSDRLLNPAYGIGELVVAIQAWEAARSASTPPHPLYHDRPGLPVVLSRLEAGDFVRGTGNGVPASAMLEVWVEIYPGTTYEKLYADFIGHLQTVAAESPTISRCTMDIEQEVRFLPASEIPVDHPLVQTVAGAYTQATGEMPVVGGAPFACDVYVFNHYSPTPCLILGPRGENAHAPDEWVLLDDLVSLTKIYALAACDWCGLAG